MKQLGSTVALLALATMPLSAQTGTASGNFALSAVKDQWQAMANYIVQSAQDMPEAKYSYRPTADVRTFGEIIGHVAGAQNMICGVALGEPPSAEDAIEKTAKTKQALIDAMKASNAKCVRAYGISEADSRKALQLFGQSNTRFGALVLNATHAGEHYGNLVTYLRINGMVPPSSRGGM